jgi:hypothetical protein
VNSLEDKSGSLATTGSNTFFGTQTFSGSVYIKENLIVQGSSSLQNITASAVDIGTNRIILNVDNPSIRYAGISVYDSGSTGGTGSLWWDSVENHWLYEHPSDSAAPYNSAILISGPKNAGNLGEELELVNNYIVKAVGGDHISSSAIYDDGTTISLKSNTEISGTFRVAAYSASFNGNVGIGTTNPGYKLDINGLVNSKGYIINGDYSAISGVPNAGIYGTDSSFTDGFNSLIVASRTDAARPIIFATYNGSSFAERARITGAGSVGIGTATPDATLAVHGQFKIKTTNGDGNENRLFLNPGGAGDPAQLYLYNQAQTNTIYISAAGDSYFNGGNLAIGTTSSTSKLDVQAAGANGIVLLADSNDANNSGRLFFMRTGGEGWAIMNNAANLSFRSNAVPGNTSGSERMRLDSSYNLILNNGLSVAGATNLTGALRMNNGTGGSSPRITFGTEDETVPGNKSIYLDTYWMVIQPHVNEGLRIRFVNGSGSQTETVRFQSTQMSVYTNLLPGSDASYNLGSTGLRWNNVYTTDLHLSNEGKQNSVDGTWGDWTLQEGENDIYMLNNRSGEKFKIKLEKIIE